MSQLGTDATNAPLSTVVSIFGNTILFWAFFTAILFPADHASFFYSTGSLIMLLEFLNLHSTGMAMGGAIGTYSSKLTILGKTYESHTYDNKAKLTLLGFYSIFALVFLAISGDTTVIFYFIVSLVAKFFFGQSNETKTVQNKYLLTFGFYMILTIFCMAMEWLIVLLFPLPASVLFFKPANTSGLMVDSPQVFIVEGVLYFFLLILIDVWYLIKNVNR